MGTKELMKLALIRVSDTCFEMVAPMGYLWWTGTRTIGCVADIHSFRSLLETANQRGFLVSNVG